MTKTRTKTKTKTKTQTQTQTQTQMQMQRTGTTKNRRSLESPTNSARAKKSRLEAENAALRHQLTVLQRKVRGRVQFTTEGTRLGVTG
jgi:hypothetical protein